MRTIENFAAIGTALNRGLARIVIAPGAWKINFVSAAKVFCNNLRKTAHAGEQRYRGQLNSGILSIRNLFAFSISRWLLLISGCCGHRCVTDQPQWGHAWSRNMFSREKNLPASFDPQTGRHLKWSARLGTETHSTPVIAGGHIYIGTNNGNPRNSAITGDRGILMCFDQRTGHFLWQVIVPKRTEDHYFDWPQSGIASPATVEGDRVYLVSNRGEVLCLEARNGNELWNFNLTSGAGIWSHDAAHTSILIHGEHLYLNTGTGVDNTHKRIRNPEAPSLVVLDKGTGVLLARDNENIAPNIFHSTWSSPSLGIVQGRPLIFFAAGDGMVYAFEPLHENFEL